MNPLFHIFAELSPKFECLANGNPVPGIPSSGTSSSSYIRHSPYRPIFSYSSLPPGRPLSPFRPHSPVMSLSPLEPSLRVRSRSPHARCSSPFIARRAPEELRLILPI